MLFSFSCLFRLFNQTNHTRMQIGFFQVGGVFLPLFEERSVGQPVSFFSTRPNTECARLFYQIFVRVLGSCSESPRGHSLSLSVHISVSTKEGGRECVCVCGGGYSPLFLPGKKDGGIFFCIISYLDRDGIAIQTYHNHKHTNHHHKHHCYFLTRKRENKKREEKV